MPRRTRNFDRIKSRRPEDTVKYRDVYESQNLDRTFKHQESSRAKMYSITALLTVITFIASSVACWLWRVFVPYFIAIRDQGIAVNLLTVQHGSFTIWQLLLILMSTGLAFGITYFIMWRDWTAENSLMDVSDINTYQYDQYIKLPEEIHREFAWVPDAGAHFSETANSILSHAMLSAKGIKSVDVVQRYDKDQKVTSIDKDGDVEEVKVYKGEVMYDQKGRPITEKLPLIDEAFGQALYTASKIPPQAKNIRKFVEVSKIPYNPLREDGGRQYSEKRHYDTVGELINNDWTFPEYEVQRPAGAYLVEQAPVNTLVVAITRAGKGQTYIEPQIDIWTRMKDKGNIVINDPKGELIVKFFVPGTVRGFEVYQFNLINPMNTDICNPIGLAVEEVRKGNYGVAASYIENISGIFFPPDAGDEPMWNNAAGNAFKRSVYGLIDYYFEEEKQLRREAEATQMDEAVLEQKIDELWGGVTLYNCYQFFVTLSSKRSNDENLIKLDPDESLSLIHI